MRKKIDEKGTVHFVEDEQELAVLAADFDPKTKALALTISGSLLINVQPYLAAELQFYNAVDINEMTVDCDGIVTIAPGCFMELFNLKLSKEASGTKVSFINKVTCIVKLEKVTGKKL